MTAFTLGEIATLVQGECVGDPEVKITGIAPLGTAEKHELSFMFDPRYREALTNTNAGAVLITKDNSSECPVNSIIVTNPYVAYAVISQKFNNYPATVKGIHANAVVSDKASIGNNVSIGPNTVIYDNVSIGDNVVIGAGCVIRDNVQIGDNSSLYDNISIYHSCVLGKNVILHSGVVIGADGFGIAKDKGKWYKIAQLGSVEIHDDVEIGANTTVDRGAMSNTILHKGVKLDNQIQIGHNVVIGENTAIAGCTGIAGSVNIGKDCLIGGAVGISGHKDITDNVTILAFSGVRKPISKSGVYAGAIGCMKHRDWSKTEARLKKLDSYVKELQELKKQIEKEEENNAN